MWIRSSGASLSLVLVLSRAWCWGTAGHHIVALMAEQRLSPEARAKISKLLLDGKYSLADISTCADAVQGNPRPREEFCRALAGDVPATNGTWHYINIPVPTKAKTLEAFCKDDNCVTARNRRFAETLRTSTDDAQKRRALLFLVHFIGDIHQPLHSAERACDRGGNSERVNFAAGGRSRNNVTLHSVWDSDEVSLLMKNSTAAEERAGGQLERVDQARQGREVVARDGRSDGLGIPQACQEEGVPRDSGPEFLQ